MIILFPIATIRNTRQKVEDDHWGEIVSVIELTPTFTAEALLQIDEFSHAEIIYYFHLVEEEKIETSARHPRNNKDWPKVGIFAQRGKNRPNRVGATIVKIIKREGIQLFVQGLDAIDGTPVLDIKPVMKEFLPREEIHQPEWATELMKNYWCIPSPNPLPEEKDYKE
jgi:tRNA-Thr(GGU) m(6)t(6)A37 methyltransferase TsaA